MASKSETTQINQYLLTNDEELKLKETTVNAASWKLETPPVTPSNLKK